MLQAQRIIRKPKTTKHTISHCQTQQPNDTNIALTLKTECALNVSTQEKNCIENETKYRIL